MRYFVLALLGFLSLILESTIFNELIIAGVKPDLVLVIVILFALFNGPRQGALVGLGLGLLEDIYLAKYIGLNAISKFTIGLIVGFMEKRMYKDNFLVPVLGLFFGSLIYCAIYFIYSGMVGYPLSFGRLLKIALPMAIYNTCFAPFIYGRFYKASTKGILKA
ncbi:MAG: rod shape-determining protein MreD [Clostridia bacterium]|nr:rod shape-determining protein MreD [Clostridia bacterium]MDN5323738.1 rod shape-determining protein MreD [Clostridia bacterium]